MHAAADEFHKVRVPKVFAWSKDPSGPVGSPYIILEDIPGVLLGEEWTCSDTRGRPVFDMLKRLAETFVRTTAVPCTMLGSIYFPEDYPSDIPFMLPIIGWQVSPPYIDAVRIGPIADLLWWRAYHDEPEFDRGPWLTLEDCLKAAVRLERRAVERHQEDLSSLILTRSSPRDLYEILELLDKVEALAPVLHKPFDHIGMMNGWVHPDLRANNIIIPHKTPDNVIQRMIDLTIIDWQGTSILPLPMQFFIPPVVNYEPSIFLESGEPMFDIQAVEDVPLPSNFDKMSPKEKEMVEAELRLVTRQIRYMQMVSKMPICKDYLEHPLTPHVSGLLQGILRSCADGPLPLRCLLLNIADSWFEEVWGVCPISFTMEERARHMEEMQQHDRYMFALSQLQSRLQCSVDGCIYDVERYDEAVKEMEVARNEWDTAACGRPFPFEEGQWSQFLR